MLITWRSSCNVTDPRNLCCINQQSYLFQLHKRAKFRVGIANVEMPLVLIKVDLAVTPRYCVIVEAKITISASS